MRIAGADPKDVLLTQSSLYHCEKSKKIWSSFVLVLLNGLILKCFLLRPGL